MSDKCFCHFNGYEVKDAEARNRIKSLEDDFAEADGKLIEAEKKLSTDVVLISDSYGIPDACGGVSWEQYVQQYMTDKNVSTYFAGTRGFGWAPDHENYFPTFMETIPGSDTVKDVLILCGANDGNILTMSLGTEEDIESGMAEAAALLKAKFPNAKVSLGYVGRHKAVASIPYYHRACEVYKKCTKYGIVFADGFQYVLHNRDLIESSDVHPNLAGSERVAHYAIQYLSSGHINVSEVYYKETGSYFIMVTVDNAVTHMHLQGKGNVGVGITMSGKVNFGTTVDLGELPCPTFMPSGAYGAIGAPGILYASYEDTSGASIFGNYYMVDSGLYFTSYSPGKEVNVSMACYRNIDITCPTMFC